MSFICFACCSNLLFFIGKINCKFQNIKSICMNISFFFFHLSKKMVHGNNKLLFAA